MSEDTKTTRRAANLFDLRRIIGGVFLVYGLVLFILGLFASQEEIDRAAGWNVNLWTGVGMFAFGLLMMVWAFTRPLGDELVSDEDGGGGTRGDRERPGGDADAGRQ
jgi:uncharacterized membrane protein